VRKPYWTPVALVALAALVAAGCGGDSDDSGAGGAAGEPSGLITVEMQDFAFEADNWTVAAGTPFEIHLENTGFNQHSWAIIRQGREISAESDFDEDEVLSVTVEEAGTYQVICTIGGHFAAGMEGKLFVVS
jgi:plastocyanin